MQMQRSFGGVIGGFYAGQRQCEAVEGCAGICTRAAGGVSAYGALDVHQAALDPRGFPAGCDGGVGAFAAVDDCLFRRCDVLDEAGVAVGVFGAAPVPVDDVGAVSGDE